MAHLTDCIKYLPNNLNHLKLDLRYNNLSENDINTFKNDYY